MIKLLRNSLLITFTLLGTILCAQNTQADKTDVAKKQKKSTIDQPLIKDALKEKNAKERKEAPANYQKQNITTITNFKDSILSVYGTFKAARAAGALVPLPKKELTPNNTKQK